MKTRHTFGLLSASPPSITHVVSSMPLDEKYPIILSPYSSYIAASTTAKRVLYPSGCTPVLSSNWVLHGSNNVPCITIFTSYDIGSENTFLHPRLVDTTFVIVVMVEADVTTTSVFSDVRVFVNEKTFSGARSNGDRTTSAPETGHFSCFFFLAARGRIRSSMSPPPSLIPSPSSSPSLVSRDEFRSDETVSDDDGDISVGAVQLSDRSNCCRCCCRCCI